ncbi:hypothetical protein [Rhizobium tumorigenes]|uniref:Lipoprotein n=1 Tax=Rhizobium tumorigenes TaxID=2041385 RepID=A0AAF1KJ28_9HYPH|nr:hypothetical protein [Rhizobium tumorigenes]WFR96948.1 hypothetical protein PR017_07500 [Rhizobium tumorigenes]
MRISTNGILTAATLSALAVFAASCQSKRAPEVTLTQPRTALSTMERVAVAAHGCWFKSSDPAFARYTMAPELNSFTGRPRFLVVERSQPTGRPLLVVQAEGDPAKLAAFGPLMNGPNSARITSDINRWAGGTKGC